MTQAYKDDLDLYQYLNSVKVQGRLLKLLNDAGGFDENRQTEQISTIEYLRHSDAGIASSPVH